jgi:hypothetical protein
VGTEGRAAFSFSVEISNADKFRTLYDMIINSQPNLKEREGEWGLYLDNHGFMFATDINVRSLFRFQNNIGKESENPIDIMPCTYIW